MHSKYDDEIFFDKYALMPRSTQGLGGAGEWHMLRRLFPGLEGKTMLDLGCGYGWHCQYASQSGAATVLGIDSSVKMIAEAKKRNGGERITYRVCGIDTYEYPENEWDFAFSNLALHYIENIDSVYAQVYRTLKPNGVFLFNIEHPVFTAGTGQDWIYDSEHNPLYWPVDDYFLRGARRTAFLGCDVTKYHHTLSDILMGLLRNGFCIESVEEAVPESPDLPGMRDELRRPMMLLVKAAVNKQ